MNGQRRAKVRLVEQYLDGLRRGDLSGAAFAADVCFQGPTTPPLHGPEAVTAFLSSQFASIRDIRIHRHVVEGDYVVTLFDYDTVHGVVAVLDLFEVADGQLRSIRPFFDSAALRSV